jgi:hypothetical protein
MRGSCVGQALALCALLSCAAPPPPPLDSKALTFTPRALGGTSGSVAKPIVAHVRIADLDRDGVQDILACDVLAGRVIWARGQGGGAFVETSVSEAIEAPVHVEAVDLDRDGDLDLLVAAMGILLPNNEPLGRVIVLENDGRQRFRTRVLAEHVARVTDVQAGDLDGDGDLDLAVGQFGYDQGEIRWMENRGGWRFASHRLLALSGTIHTPIADMDGDGDLDVVALVSQEWEEVDVFENDGHGRFTARRVFGAATEQYCSSGIAVGDLDGDADLDVLYTNGDAFVATDYRPLPNHGVQWLENRGGLKFAFHRIASFPGAYSPRIADVDGDGDADGIVVSAFNDWSSAEARSLAWIENRGHGELALHGLASAPTHLIAADAADLDGDGRVDLVTAGMALYAPFDRIERLTVWSSAR